MALIAIVALAAAIGWLHFVCLRPMTFCLTFDDGMKAHATIAAPELEKRGWRGAFNVPTNIIGGAKLSDVQLNDMGLCGHEDMLMDWDDVNMLLAHGHEVGPHTSDHVDLVDLERAGRLDEIDRQIRQSKQTFEQKTGLCPRFFCLPHNKNSTFVTAAIRRCGMEPFSCSRLNFGEPGHMNYFGTITDYLTEQYRFGRSHVDIMIHGILKSQGGWRPFADEASFAAFLDEIVRMERGRKIKVVSYSSVHGGSGIAGRVADVWRRVEAKARRAVFKVLVRK